MLHLILGPLCLLPAGCVVSSRKPQTDEVKPSPPAIQSQSEFAPTRQVRHETETLTLPDGDLTAATLIAAVLARNPTIEEMSAATAAARVPIATALDDPMLGFATAPGSYGTSDASFAARVEITQKYPLGRKRELRGQIAAAEAMAATRSLEEARLQLTEDTRIALADYSQAHRLSGIVDDNVRLLKEFRKNAQTRYQNGQVPQQDVLQADVEIVRAEEQRVAVARAHRHPRYGGTGVRADQRPAFEEGYEDCRRRPGSTGVRRPAAS